MKLILRVLALIMALSTPIALAKDLKSYGGDCEKIGFKPKTTAYGKCILELSREDIGIPLDKVVKSKLDSHPANLPEGFISSKTLGSPGWIEAGRDSISRLDGDGTLIWSRNNTTVSPHGRANFEAAVTVCNAMNSAGVLGYSIGWRLPTQQELSGLYNLGTTKLFLAGWTFERCWTSTPFSGGGHYTVYLSIAEPYSDNGNSYVSCVHQDI
jgi:hypothetical protein